MNQEMIGKIVAGRYRILEEIGRGGLATVYRAIDIRFNRVVALKVLHPHFARDAEFERRFQLEARVMARVSHPNIVRMYDYGEAEGLSYLAVEYVEGRSLAQVLAQGKPLDTDYAIEIIRQVGEALSYGHRQGIIHRDIKPSNILISKDGRVLLSDFGLARATATTSLTRAGTILGTPEYMSPEQAQGQPLDLRSDIYALGLVLYELLTGHLPFSGESPLHVLYQHVRKPPPSPRQFNPTVPSSLEQVVLKALAKDPMQRYQTVDEFLSALIAAGERRLAAGAPAVAPARKVAPTKAAPTIGVIAGAVGLAFCLIVLLVFSIASSPTVTPIRVAIATATPTIRPFPSTTFTLPPTATDVLTTPAVTQMATATAVPQLTITVPLPTTSVPLTTATPTAISLIEQFPGQRYAFLWLLIFVVVAGGAILLVFVSIAQRLRLAPSPIRGTATERRPITSETLPYSPLPMPGTATLAREPSAMAWLLGLNGIHRGHKFELAARVTIGRDASQCDIALDDLAVSKRHAEMRLEDSRFHIYDLGSTNGTFVNGMRVSRRQELRDRDEIRMGNTIMLFVQAVSPEDLTVEAKRRVREFDSVWDQLTGSIRHD